MSKRETPLVEGHFYHIYNRGNNGENLFIEERNYPYFLQLYSHHIFPIADTYAYCLMRNHFHLLIRIQPKNLDQLPIDYSKQFSNLFNAYTRTINKTYHRTGSLFEKPFKRILVDSDSYFTQLVRYIHHNPQKHRFTDDFRTYPYSSYIIIQQQKLSRLESQQVIDWFGDIPAFEEYHRQSNENTIHHLVEDDFH
jgi:REP element-mobilizing transposase RayT